MLLEVADELAARFNLDPAALPKLIRAAVLSSNGGVAAR
jgi:hypothetical protein